MITLNFNPLLFKQYANTWLSFPNLNSGNYLKKQYRIFHIF